MRGTMPVASITSSKPRRSSASTRRASATRRRRACEARAEVAQRLGELLLAGNAPREVELAADLRRGVEQRDRRGRAPRPSSPPPGPPARRRPPRPSFAARAAVRSSIGLVAGTRIDQARRDLAREDVVEAGLVAADAGVDLVGAILPPPCCTNSGSARNGRAIDTMSASPRASTASPVAGSLMRLVVISGMPTAPFSRRVTHANAARGTMVAMVGMRASCQPMPVLMIVAPAASTAWASATTSSHVLPPSTRSSIDRR